MPYAISAHPSSQCINIASCPHLLMLNFATLVAPRAPSPDRQRDMNPLGRPLRRVPSANELRSAALEILEGKTEHLTREELEARGRDMLTSRYAK